MFEKASKSFSFVGHFKIFAVISTILCSIGLIGIILSLFGVQAFNFDIDFLGGVKTEIALGTDVTQKVQEEIAGIYEDVTGVNATVTTSGEDSQAVIIKSVDISSEKRQAAFNKITEKYGKDNVKYLSQDHASASVGNDLKHSAFITAIVAGILILLYITIRFEFRSGLAAIICLLHDVLIILAFFVISRTPMNMTFLAAILTIIGYSINATIVVFDRVRENYKRQGGGGDFGEVVDKSIWQTMRRSIGTTITTLLPIIMILICGVSSIKIFALPLTVGVIAGGYSSTCIAGPVWTKLKGNKAN